VRSAALPDEALTGMTLTPLPSLVICQ